MILDDKTIMTLPPPPPYASAQNQNQNQGGVIVLQGPQHHQQYLNHNHTHYNYEQQQHPQHQHQQQREITGHTTPSHPPPPFSESHAQPARPLRLSSLPPHILLQIVWNTFPHPDAVLLSSSLAPGSSGGHGYGGVGGGAPHEDNRKIFLWLAKSLRLVSRSLYIACMHVLRSTYHTAYTSLLRPFYSSDPFPSTSPSSSSCFGATLGTIQRETPVLDMYIALRVREDVCVDDSELHLEREELFRDIFDHAQPKARLEDLVREYGVREGVVTLAPPGVVVYTTITPPGTGRGTGMGMGGGGAAGGGGGYSDYGGSDDGAGTVVQGGGRGDSKYTTTTLPIPSPTSPSHPTTTKQFLKNCITPPPQPPRSTSRKFFSAFRRQPKTPSPPATIVALHQPTRSSTPSRAAPPPPPPPKRIRPLPFALLSISYGTRKVGLQLVSVETGAKKTIVEVQRMSRDEPLEVTARRVVGMVKELLVEES